MNLLGELNLLFSMKIETKIMFPKYRAIEALFFSRSVI